MCRYQRVLLKISGEGLSGTGGFGLVPEEIDKVATEIAEVASLGCGLALVVGAGNLVRGASLCKRVGLQRVTGDQMGMLATVMNSLALRDTLEARGVPACVLSAFPVGTMCEPFSQRQAVRYLDSGHVVILAGGTGNPFFTTDTCASLRAAEIGADVLIKATKVDGVYSADPVKDRNAVLYDELTFTDVLSKELAVMDLTAITMCRDNDIDIIVCNLMKPHTVATAVRGEKVGTRVSAK